MKCRINLDSDPISLIILSADGYEHAKFDGGGHDSIIDVDIRGGPCLRMKVDDSTFNQLLQPLEIEELSSGLIG